MSTADELVLIMGDAERRLAPFRARLQAHINALLIKSFGREVCARRARKLRRRGTRVVFARRTSTGKRRYSWIPGPVIRWEGIGS